MKTATITQWLNQKGRTMFNPEYSQDLEDMELDGIIEEVNEQDHMADTLEFMLENELAILGCTHLDSWCTQQPPDGVDGEWKYSVDFVYPPFVRDVMGNGLLEICFAVSNHGERKQIIWIEENGHTDNPVFHLSIFHLMHSWGM